MYGPKLGRGPLRRSLFGEGLNSLFRDLPPYRQDRSIGAHSAPAIMKFPPDIWAPFHRICVFEIASSED